MGATKAGAGRSLTDYVQAKRRAACAVCSLPEDIREQIKASRGRKVTRDTVLEWLRDEHGIDLTHEALTAHDSAHHDRASA